MNDNIIRPDESSADSQQHADGGFNAEDSSQTSNQAAEGTSRDFSASPSSEAESQSSPAESNPAPIGAQPDSQSADPVEPTATGHSPILPKPTNVRTLSVVAIIFVLMLVAACAGGYAYGKKSVKPSMSSVAATTTAATMAVPKGATIIEQCQPGLGTQYILPKDIPGGPVYNVYQGKLIGIEYMVDLASMEKLNTMKNNLPLFGQQYDHVNVMSMAAHAGFPTPHYQVDIMMVPQSVTDKITCGGNSSGMSNMPSSSSTTPMSAPMNSSSNMKM